MTVIHKLYQYLFLALGLFLTWQINAQSYISIPVTGFNHDLIAEGSGGLNRADSTTTTTFDNVNAGGDNVMYSKDFRGNNNPNTAPPFGLPVNRIINSVNLVGANYLLAPYDGKNALVLKTNGSTGTLVLGTPGVFSKIAFLGSSAEGVSGFNVVLNFSDGTNSSSTFSVPDWYFGSNFAIKGIGRVTRTQIGTQAPDLFTGDSENPRLYDNQITLAPPFNTKILTSISFNKTSSTGNTAILAINGITPVNAPSAPIATAATNVNATSFVANWNAATGATAYYLDVSTNSNFTAILPAYNNRNVNNVVNFSVSGITNNQNYFYRVRAANASGVSPSSNTINVIYVQCPPGAVIVNTQAQIDNFKLVYPTCTIINGNLNITDGPDISNVNGFSNILEIKSQLNIVNNAILNDLTGLSKLTKVNSNFWIAANKSLRQVKDFTNLTSSGFLYIGSNPQLVEISGFPKIAVMPGLVFENNDSLAIVNLNSKVIQTVENVTIKNNPKLQKIESIGIVMWINSILTLDNNSSLTDLSALNNIDLIKELVIQNNANLQNLNNLTKLTRMNGSIQLRNNSKLSDISGLQNIIPELIKGSGLIILNNPVLNLCNLPNFCTYLQGSGARSISGNAGNCLNEQAVLNICNALSAPVATAASNITETSFTANWQAVSGATSYFLDASTDPSFSTLPIDNFDAGNQLSTTITGAAPNTTYYYRIRAGNSNGQSPNSNVISVTTTNVAPIAPVALAATNVIASGFTANWQANSNTTGYFIDVSTNSNFSSFVTGYNNLSVGNVQNANITGLQLNTTYYFRIRAGNAVGTSPNSNVISVTTSNLAPAAPTALAATNISAIGFTANWQSNSNTTGYFIDVSTNSNFSNFVTGYNNFSTGNVVNTNITGLTLNTTYYYRIRANNGIGTSPNSNVISVTTSNIAPSAPTALAATNISAIGFTANWQSNSNTTGYFIDVSTNSNFSNFVTGYNNFSTGNVVNTNITGLTLNTTYYYRIRANNGIGTSPNSNVISVTTSNIAPSAPTAIAATNIASTSFTANWQIVNNATEYRIDLSQNSSFSSFVGNYNNLSVGNVQNINITGLVMNTTYFYRIRAINSIGTSLNSNVIQVTTLNNNVAAKPIAVTGFNHDIIANGAGGANRALTSTTNDFGTFVLYSKDFRGNNNQTSAPKYGLADNGKIINANRPGYDFQLANYTGNNALLLKNVNESGTLSLVSQDTVSSFVILATSENGISNVNALATFSDGTNTPFTFSINDWFGQPNFAIKGIGRITRSNDIFDSGESAEDPRLYNHEVVFPGPFSSKRLVSISFTKTSSTGSLAILAITGIFKESVQDCKLTIPDANFKSYLISNSNININGDNAIQCSEAENFTGEIICPNLQIKDLTGIEEFPNLSILQCNDNELSKLDLSKNRKLIKLSCNNNQIDKLNLSANPLLIEVFCSSNQLTSINLEQNLLLQTFDCNTNNIGFLDISKNTSLTMLRCYTNKLSSLNLANGINEDMNLIEANNNPGLSCIKVDNAEYSKSNWITSSFKFDPQHEFKLECDACDEWRERLNSNFLISSDACVGDSIHLIDYSKIELDSSIVFAWNFGNGITSKERDPVISYSAEGNYKISLQLENPSCKSFEIQKSISIKSCLTGIGVSLNSAILYPNPNSGDIVLDINLNESSPVSIQVCNSNGKMVKEYEFSEFKVFEEKISIDDSGIYFIVIKHKQGIINLKTIVVK